MIFPCGGPPALPVPYQNLQRGRITVNKITLQTQTVLYHNAVPRLLRSLEYLANAWEVARRNGLDIALRVVYGDASSQPLFTQEEVQALQDKYRDTFAFSYEFFHENTGTAKGHNRMTALSDTAYIMIMNPDIVLGPRTLLNLLAPFERDGEAGKVAMTEARQTPVEHPKAYDAKTLETSWASTACTIIRRKCFDEVQGFDADTFFMYCDDLDFSWRLRLAGYKLIYCPDAVVFHDKTIDRHGRWETTKAERRFSAEASILLAHKWSRPKLRDQIIRHYEEDREPDGLFAVESYRKRAQEGRLPKPIDPLHRIADFSDEGYGAMRFTL